ncbi:hypothetical protein EWU23_13490 [Cytophagaceae bacterium 50C-KIRBA]|uniref:SMODS-associating 2TM beta-strand rich effector domain-containing protein n=1 Tax=Aquirufa beregesia TaxID=2516556 RepID=A0ABX0F0R8_9BACT|nr:hypothetical protein [Aquirufa beregesia]NGZ45492.1 hypothetical protein [Aquirufa beregesia]
MFENLIERINQGLWQRTLAFFTLWFAVYSVIWTILEPLNLEIVTCKRDIWRMLFVGSTFIFNVCIYFMLFFRKKLEIIGLDTGDTNILNTVISIGKPKLNQENDGFQGRVLNIKADYDTEPLDWNIKASALKASRLSITYKAEPRLIFYARISVLSKNKTSTKEKWLRFEPNISLPQSLADDEEMGVPVVAINNYGLLRLNIYLPKIVQDAYSAHGWQYDKVLTIRARGSGIIKNIVLK